MYDINHVLQQVSVGIHWKKPALPPRTN